MRLVCAAGILFLSASAMATDAYRPTVLTPTQQKTVRDTVARGLRDPEAARFGHYTAGKGPKGEIMVCGMVNGKNAYGAYVGERPYDGVLVSDHEFIIMRVAEDELQTRAVYRVCAESGLPL